VRELLAHVRQSGAALDFVTTHTYGNAPLGWRPVLEQYGKGGIPIRWTEWGPTPTHFHGIGDGPFGATFLLHGMKSAAGRIEALAHWVASDHFEELGTPPRLVHHRIDEEHSNIERVWREHSSADWPQGDEWEALKAANVIDTLEADRAHGGGPVVFELPMPGVSYVELIPEGMRR
jgi:beta-xylosidase